MVEANPAFGYCTVAHLLDFNEKQLPAHLHTDALAGEESTHRLAAADQVLHAIASRPNKRWSTDMVRMERVR